MTPTRLPFQPLANQLLLEPIKTPEKIGNIFLPEKVRHPVNQGTIVAQGETVPNCGLEFKIGNIVVFPLYADSVIEMDRTSYMVVDYTQVLLSDFGYFSNIAKDVEQSQTEALENLK